MNEDMSLLLVLMEAGGVFAPLAFILFHLLRSFLFIPVPVVLISGGVLFGTLWGTLYSVVGLMGVSLFSMSLLTACRKPRSVWLRLRFAGLESIEILR